MKYDLYNNDCMDILPSLSEKVDLVLVDPPYGTTDCMWDNVLTTNRVWDYVHNCSTSLSSYLFFGSEPFSTVLKSSNLDEYKYDWYWIKPKCSGFLHSKNKPLTNVEHISVFSRGCVAHKNTSDRRMTYNPQGLVKKKNPQPQKSRRVNKETFKNASFKHDTFFSEYTNYPKQTLYFNQVNNPVHPTQKPVPLLEYLIKTYTEKGDTVLDFTMGSGSTGVACMNTGRNFVGIEKETEYYLIAEERIREARVQQRLTQ